MLCSPVFVLGGCRWPLSAPNVGGTVAHGWNINELNTGKTDATDVVCGGIGCGCMVFMLS